MAALSPYVGGPYVGGTALNYKLPPKLGMSPDDTLPFARTLGAMFNLESPLLSYSIHDAFGLNEDTPEDPGFDPTTRMVRDNDFHYYSVLKDAKNEDHYNRLKQKADWEFEQREILANVGITENLLAGLAVGVVDPLNLAVGVFTGGAATFGGAAFRSVASSLVVTGTNELFLQQTQVTRTAEEAALNVVGDMIFTTALGMGAYGIARTFGVSPEKMKSDFVSEEEYNMSLGMPGMGFNPARRPGQPGYANDLQPRPIDKWGSTIHIAERPDGIKIDPRTGKSYAASYNPQDHTIYYNRDRIVEMFRGEEWRDGPEGVDKLDSSNFPTETEWFHFVLEHEYAHQIHKPLDGESLAKYENRINAHALEMLRVKSRMGVHHRPIKEEEHAQHFNRIKAEYGEDVAKQMKAEGAFGQAFAEIDPNYIPGEGIAGPARRPLDEVESRYHDEMEAESINDSPGMQAHRRAAFEKGGQKLLDASDLIRSLTQRVDILKKKLFRLKEDANDLHSQGDIEGFQRAYDEIDAIKQREKDLDAELDDAYRALTDIEAEVEARPATADSAPKSTEIPSARSTGTTEHGDRHIQLLYGKSWTTKLVNAIGLQNLKFSPMLAGMASSNPATRLYTILMVPTPTNVGNTLGHATAKSVETIRNDKRIDIAAPLAAVQKAFMGLRLGKKLDDDPTNPAALGEVAKAQWERYRKQSEDNPLRYIHIFNREVARAVRSKGTHENPYVAEAAAAVRNALDKVTKEAESLLMFKGDTVRASSGELDLMGAQSFLPRIILHDVLDNHIEEYIRVIVAWQRAHAHAIPDNLNDKLALVIRSGDEAAHTEIIRKQALRAGRKLSGVEDFDIEATDIAGSMKGRTVWVDDNVLAGDNLQYGGSGRSFLENDIDAILKAWMPQMHTDIELTKQFGSVDMAAQFATVREMAVRDAKANNESVFTKTIDKGGSEPLVVQTTKSAEYDIEKLSAMRDLLRGVFSLSSDPLAISSRAARLMTDFTNMALMGNVMVSSIPDAGRLVMVNKLHAFKALHLVFDDFKKMRSLMREQRDLGVGMEMVLSSRAQALVHQGDIPRYTRAERIVGRGTEVNFIINGLNPWNAVIKQASGIATTSRLISDFRRYAAHHGNKNNPKNLKPLSDVEMTKLSAAGVNQEIVRQILALHNKYGDTHRGLEMPNASLWDLDDPDFGFDVGETLLTFRRIIQEEVDRQIVTPGAGDIPLWIRKSPMADTVEKSLLGERMSADEAAKYGPEAKEGDRPGQFGKYGRIRKEAAALYPALGNFFGIYKSFIAGSWSRVMIPGLQNRDSGELLGLTTMLLLGGMAKTLKDWSYDRPGPRDLKDFLVEGFDQSGLGSWFMFANSQGEALLDIGLRPLLGMPRFDPSLRWQTSTALGANVGQLLRGGRAVGDVANYIGGGDFSSSSATNMYRLAPFNSLFYLRLHNLFKFRNTADEVFGADDAVGGTG